MRKLVSELVFTATGFWVAGLLFERSKEIGPPNQYGAAGIAVVFLMMLYWHCQKDRRPTLSHGGE